MCFFRTYFIICIACVYLCISKAVKSQVKGSIHPKGVTWLSVHNNYLIWEEGGSYKDVKQCIWSGFGTLCPCPGRAARTWWDGCAHTGLVGIPCKQMELQQPLHGGMLRSLGGSSGG